MTGNLQFRRGFKKRLPLTAPSGMPLWCIDTKELYIGTGNGIASIGSSKIEIKNLDYEPFISLETNTIHQVEAFDDIEFMPPPLQELNYEEFNQILVQLYMPDVVSIDLGTEVFFNGKMPTLSDSGSYDIIYEFDNEIDEWVCGVIYKGFPEE